MHETLLQLMKYSDIQKYDSGKMHQAYEKWPEIAQKNYFSNDLQKIQFKIDRRFR